MDSGAAKCSVASIRRSEQLWNDSKVISTPVAVSTQANEWHWCNGPNVANRHSERSKLLSVVDDIHAKMTAAAQGTTRVFPKVILPSGGGMRDRDPNQSRQDQDAVLVLSNLRVTMHENSFHHSQPLETRKVSGDVNECEREDSLEGPKPFRQSALTTAYATRSLSETTSGNTSASLDIAYMVWNVPTANTNYVQGDSYAIKQGLAAQKAVTPTHCQNGKDIMLLPWKVHKPVLPAANVMRDMTRYDKSHTHQKCVPGMSESQEKGKQHHVASDPEDPNDEVQSVTLINAPMPTTMVNACCQ